MTEPDSTVMPDAGADWMLGAAPRTVSDSSATASTASVAGTLSMRSTRIGLATWPPGRTMMIWKGTVGAGCHENRPSLSVRTDVAVPTTDTIAPAIGVCFTRSTTRASNREVSGPAVTGLATRKRTAHAHSKSLVFRPPGAWGIRPV